jgi:ABC-type sugar transport system ATPase subunit
MASTTKSAEAAPADQGPVLLDAADVTKTFGGVHALSGASLSVRAGEVHALLGENGSGKSTLLNILVGRLHPDSGSIAVGGEVVALRSPQEARERGVALVTQDLRLVPEMSVAENVFLGDWPGRRGVSWKQMERRARATLERLGLVTDVSRPLAGLSQDQRQLVDIARAIDRDPRVLLLDEPTSALTTTQVERLFEVLRELRDAGTAIVFVSHKFPEIFALADRVTVLRDGVHVGTLAVDPASEDELIRLMVGRPLRSFFHKEEVAVGEPVLEVSGLSRGILDEVSLTVHTGEIVGLAGLAGAGRSALARTLYGLRGAYAGEVRMDGRPLAIRRPRDAIRAGIALVPEDRKRDGLVLEASVLDNFALTDVGNGRWLSRVSRARQIADAQSYIKQMQIKTPGLAAPAQSLSGGNQQKLVLAKWLRMSPRVLILDEPTQGIDIGAKVEIYQLIGEFVRQGGAVLLISSELPELLALSDRVVALYRGRVAGDLDRPEATEERVGRMIIGRG